MRTLAVAVLMAASVLPGPAPHAAPAPWPVPSSLVPAHAPYDTSGGLLWQLYRDSSTPR